METVNRILVTVVSAHIVLAGGTSEGIQCGAPGRPVNGTTHPQGKSHYPGERVSYKCLEGFVLFGEAERTCLKNGTWSGTVPLCDFNLAKGKRSLHSATLWSYRPDLAVDGNPDTCSFTPKGGESRWWQVNLGHKYNIVSIGVTISPGSFQEFTIFVIELLADDKALYKPCTTFKGVFQTQKGIFKCNDGLGHPGQFVYIRDDRQEEEYFGLCEVEVFAFRERIPCGDPQVPFHGKAEREGHDAAVYSCDPGFKMTGDNVLRCSSKGVWQGHVPQCQEVLCPAPVPPAHGYIEMGPFRGEYPMGTEARYGCNRGYQLKGTAVRVCLEKGTWSGEAPSCQAVTCGDPPMFPHSKYTLLNGTGQGPEVVVYSCLEGYRLLPGSGDHYSTCLDIGAWHYINVTCIPDLSLNIVGRSGKGRSLELSDENGSMSKVVVILAVIASLLLVGMIVVGFLFTQKHIFQKSSTVGNLIMATNSPLTFFETLTMKQKKQPSLKEHSGFSSSSRCSHNDSGFHVDHSYETLRKNNMLNKTELPEDASSIGRDSAGYETVKSGRTVGYETIPAHKESGYEEITDTDKDPQYETVKEKGHDYETIRSQKAPVYDSAEDNNDPGYEVVKEGVAEISLVSDFINQEQLPAEEMPDILLNIQESPQLPNINADISPEILALYAKVDKSKKKKLLEETSPVHAVEYEQFHSPLLHPKQSIVATKDLIQKFNQLSGRSHRILEPESSLDSNSSGTLRPLPPLPKPSGES